MPIQKLDLPYYLMLIVDLYSLKKTYKKPDDFIFNSIQSGVNMVQIRDTKSDYSNKLSLINKIKIPKHNPIIRERTTMLTNSS